MSDASNVIHDMSLSDKHRSELHASGIPDDMIAAAGIHTVGDFATLVNWKPSKPTGPAMAFPFNGTGYVRVKPDRPRIAKDGRVIKYESPKGKSNRAYFPPGVLDRIGTVDTLIITEGEKKALGLTAAGHDTIGLVGVWGFQKRRKRTDDGRRYGKRELIDDLAGIPWQGRRVVVMFDSDAATNDQVLRAECALAEILSRKGAEVTVARLPQIGTAKVGADDFLVAHGADALQSVIDNAQPAEDPGNMTSMQWAKRYIEDVHLRSDGLTLRWHRGEFFTWNGNCYRKIEDGELKALVVQWMDLHDGPTSANNIADVAHCLRALCLVAGDIDTPAMLGETATRPHLMALANGLLDLDKYIATGQIVTLKHSPKYFSTIALPYDLNPGAEPVTWYDTLAAIYNDDIETIEALGEFFGYCLTSMTKFHTMLILAGPPRSGKGTVLRMLRAVAGEQNTVAPALQSLGELFGRWSLVGKNVATFPDAHLGTGDKALQILETLKSISGEDAVEVHRKNLPAVTLRLTCKFVLAVNELPRFGDYAGALSRRVLVLPHNRIFSDGEQDRDLEEKLMAELPGVCNWALDGLRRLIRNKGFTRPAASRDIEAEFARLTNPIRAFVEDMCEVGTEHESTIDDVWAAWQSWCEQNGCAAGSKDRFGNRLRLLLPDLVRSRKRIGGQRVPCYVGLAVTGPAVPSVPSESY